MESLKNIFLIFLFVCFSGCVENTGEFIEQEVDTSGNPIPNAGNSGGSGQELKKEELISGVHIKNFNQINMSFSKLTGIDRSRTNIVDVMSQILNQLPANNDLNSFTPFHQISITRLAFNYCELFIDEDKEFSALDYGSVSSEDLADAMIERFLDELPSDEPQKYDVLRKEMLSILNNEDLTDAGKLLDESGVDRAELKERLSKMACSIILSSSFVTLI